MNLPPISVLQARSTYFIAVAIALMVATGYLPKSEAQATEDLFMGHANAFWEGAMQIVAAISGFLAWLERKNPSKSLTLAGGGAEGRGQS